MDLQDNHDKVATGDWNNEDDADGDDDNEDPVDTIDEDEPQSILNFFLALSSVPDFD